jgi:hypothetical protein
VLALKEMTPKSVCIADKIKTEGPLMSEPVAVDRSHMVCKFVSHEEQEAETIRFWNQRSIEEKMRATVELIEYAYRQKGIDIHAQRSDRSLVRLQRPRG